jgi:hypothetical protein
MRQSADITAIVSTIFNACFGVPDWVVSITTIATGIADWRLIPTMRWPAREKFLRNWSI